MLDTGDKDRRWEDAVLVQARNEEGEIVDGRMGRCENGKMRGCGIPERTALTFNLSRFTFNRINMYHARFARARRVRRFAGFYFLLLTFNISLIRLGEKSKEGEVIDARVCV